MRRQASAALLRGHDPEQRRLHVPQAIDVPPHAGDGVAEQKGLGQLDDRVGERLGLKWGSYLPAAVSSSISSAIPATIRGWRVPPPDVMIRRAASRSASTKRRSAAGGEAPIEAVECVEKRRSSAPTAFARASFSRQREPARQRQWPEVERRLPGGPIPTSRSSEAPTSPTRTSEPAQAPDRWAGLSAGGLGVTPSRCSIQP